MANLKGKFDKALKQFVQRNKKNPNVIAILVSGSYIHSKPDKNSDLDVHVVTKESKTRIRGNTWINGVEIEYFINPIKQIKYYFKTEVGNKAPCTAHMFANSKILYKKGNSINTLIKQAKQILKKPQKKLTNMEIEFSKYFIDDMEKDLEDTYLRKDSFAFNQASIELLQKSLEIFFKIKRTTKEKSKRLQPQIKRLDKTFAELYKDALTETDINLKYKKLRKLVKHIEYNLGGKRKKEWKIVSRCTT